MKKRLVIIGNGIAGLSAAKSARKKSDEIEIVLVSNEKYPTYYRTKLCEAISENKDPEAYYLYNEEWYAQQNIKLMLGVEIIEINIKDNYLKTNDGKLEYDALILATGAKSFIPPIMQSSYSNAIGLRNMDELIKLNILLESAKSVLVVGGGVLGLETASNISKRGTKTTILELLPNILPKQLDKRGSEILESIISKNGVELIKGEQIKSFVGNKRIDKVILGNDREIEADVVVFAIGARSDIELAAKCNINLNKAICVDLCMRTNIPNVFACGDASECEGVWYGVWTASMLQGNIAGENAALYLKGEVELNKIEIQKQPYFLNAFNTKIYSMGDVNKSEGDNIENIIEEVLEDKSYMKLIFENSIFIGYVLIGNVKLSQKLTLHIKNASSKEEVMNLIKG